MTVGDPLTFDVLALDPLAEADRIAGRLKETAARDLRKRGFVIAISGGVDSAVCAALAVRAAGPERVYGLLLPERDSAPASVTRGRTVAEWLGIRHEIQDISPVLEALGCYRERDTAIRRVVPNYGSDWKCKITIAGGRDGRINHFRLVVESPAGEQREQRLPLDEYLQIVAATNYKQRVRKAIEYFHADRLNYAVVGAPNRLEYDQGFFVKSGDGAADVKPIAHLYKTQVYDLARALGVPADIVDATPTTDTYSLIQGQDEFYFALPYHQMDLALWGRNHDIPAATLASALGITPNDAQRVYDDIDAKRRATTYLHRQPMVIEPVPEVGGGLTD